MKIATYNLFEGAKNTYPLLTNFVRQQDLDVICLQEANGWRTDRTDQMASFAAATGLAHYVYGDSNTRFKLATFSRLPIDNAKVYKDGFWHSAVRTGIAYDGQNLDVWNIHLDPKSEDRRLPEASRITNTIGRFGIAMGDFNSLSMADRYPGSLLASLQEKGITKFGTTELRYDVTDHFAAAGFIDLAAEFSADTPTVPTPANTDMFHAADLRLDYMFATRSLLSSVRDISVIKNDLTDRISDHYPVVLTLV